VTLSGLGARVAGLALTAVTHLWLARELGPAGYGSFVLALVVNGVAVLVANVGVGSAVALMIARTPAHSRAFLLGGIMAAIVSVLLALAALVPFFFIGRFAPFPGVTPAWLAVAFAVVPLRILQEVFAGATVGFGQSGRSLALSIATPVFLVAGLLAAWSGGALSEAAVASAWWTSQFASLVAAVALAQGTLSAGTWNVPMAFRSMPSIFRIGAQQTLNMAAWWFLVRTDRSIVGALAGAEAAGRFAIVSSLADVALSLPSVVAVVTFHGLSREGASRAAETVQRLTRETTLVTGAAVVLGVPLLGLASQLILGSAYGDVVLIFLALAPGIVALTPATLVAAYFFAVLGRPALNLLSTAAALSVLVPTVWVLTGLFGVAGAAAGTSLAYVTAGIVSVALFSAHSDTIWQRTIWPTLNDGRNLLRMLSGADASRLSR
jgi:O-antigen/teichoic acid export membrane protein